VALAGRSGAGKSTVAAVLLRFCDPVGGTVPLGGAALGSYAADGVRTVIGGCLQDPHIFNATIRDNLGLAGRTRATTSWQQPPIALACCPGSVPSPRAAIPGSALTTPPCPAGSGSGSHWPGRCSPTRRC
jgi:hypothetical protein